MGAPRAALRIRTRPGPLGPRRDSAVVADAVEMIPTCRKARARFTVAPNAGARRLAPDTRFGGGEDPSTASSTAVLVGAGAR